MPLKPPSRGTTSVEIHAPPRSENSIAPPKRDALGHFESDYASLPLPRDRQNSNPRPDQGDLDAILPEPTLTINELPVTDPAARRAPLPLSDYRINPTTQLPAADAQGLRHFKGRLFVDGHDGSTVHVALDPDSNLYRAKLQSERKASGPILLRDPDSRLWHPLDDFESITFPLKASRLQDYRTPLDFSDSEPDNTGLYRFEKKLYAVIEGHAYQVLHDRDASSPKLAVMRIVRAQDPVAGDEGNRYVATRPGKSEPVFFHEQIGWRGLIVGGAGGMFGGNERSWRRQLDAAVNQHLRSPRGRVRKLFPSMGTEAIDAFLHSLGDDVATRLTQRESQYGTLKQELKSWAQTNTGLSAKWTKDVSTELLRGWRRETGTTLTLPSEGGALPPIQADFSHIRTLNIESITWSASADTFLGNFTTLENLSIARSTLAAPPAALREMHQLKVLDLRANRIRLDNPGTASFNRLARLEHLDLSRNPLGMPPDVHDMSGLSTLKLRSTGIDQWPAGLLTRTSLKIVDLRDNRLQEVPQAYLNPPAGQLESTARINGVTLLDGNPLPADYWQHFDTYWQRLHLEYPQLMADATPGAFDGPHPKVDRYRAMFPSKTLEEGRRFIRTLASEAEPELIRLEREFRILEDQLGAWSFSGGGARQRYIRANQMRLEQGELGDRYLARGRIFECWRREAPQKLAHDGTPIGMELDLSGLRLPSLPDLDIDFSHVGSLKLNNMNLSASPEGFLSRFRHVRWLDLSNNRLRDLPPAIGEMQGMTRLFLQDNQIILTPDTARILSERVTLRALMLERNPLGIAPDFSLITDMRSLNLSHTGIDTWPSGLAEQPSLDSINLSNNRLTSIPEAVITPPDARLEQTARINNVTGVNDNPLSDATMTQVRLYEERLLERGITAIGRPNRLVTTARLRSNRRLAPTRAGSPFERWSHDLPDIHVTSRRAQWQTLSEHPGAGPLFELLARLQTGGPGHSDQQRRVWDLLDTISENSPESERLRGEIFDRAGEPACCDRAAFTFGNLEILSMTYRARTQALDQSQGHKLAEFSRRLLRLHEVDRIAAADIQNSEAIVRDPATSAEDRRWHSQRLNEEVEIRLAYRFGLKDRLQLPGQPKETRFTSMGRVDQGKLDRAYDQVKVLDDSPLEREALLSREFWQDYLTNKYRREFEEQRTPFHDQLADLHERFLTHQLTEPEYRSKSDDLKAQLDIQEAALMESLTRRELDSPAVGAPATAD